MIARPRLMLRAVMLTGLLSACASTGETPGFTPELSNTHDHYAQVMQQRDMTSLEAFFVPDAELKYKVSSIVGRARILGYFTSSGTEYGSSMMRPVKITANGDAEVTERGRWFGRSRNGTYTHVWVRLADGQWRLKSIEIFDDAQPLF